MFPDGLQVVVTAWPCVVISAVLIGLGAWTGWRVARFEGSLFVRSIRWWLTRVIVPVLLSSPWPFRAAVIFLNNTFVLAAVLAAGFNAYLSIVAVAVLGLSLGTGLKILASHEARLTAPSRALNRGAQRRVNLGMGLNLLEPPAILLATSLSLCRAWSALPSALAWRTYICWAVPLLLIAACGEALWLGACCYRSGEALRNRGVRVDRRRAWADPD